jgi:uncharacterized membrane protein
VKRILKFMRATLAGGVLFLVPIVVLIVVFQKALGFADKIVAPLAERLPFDSIVGMRTPVVLAVTVLVLFCLGAGLLARTRFAQRIIDSLENSVLSNIPGYHLFKSMGEDLLGIESATPPPVVVVHLDEAWQFALQIETLENGLVAVYVPDSPHPTSGSVVFVTPDRVTPTTLAERVALKCMKRIGVGSRALLRGIELKGLTREKV